MPVNFLNKTNTNTMKRSEKYQNLFPFEDLIIIPKEDEITEIVVNCDYTIESNKIDKLNRAYNKINISDAVVFFEMGIKAAIEQIEAKLTPI